MTTFIKMKFMKSDDQTNIEKYKVAANITDYHTISNFNLPQSHYSKINEKARRTD